MKNKFKSAWKIYKYVILLYTLIFIPYMVHDDWGFWMQYGRENWAEYIYMDFRWWLAYLIVVSIYYWVLTSFVIFIFQLITRKK